MPHYEYRVIPAETEVGGDDIYLGTATGDAGKLLPVKLPEDGETGAPDRCDAAEAYIDPIDQSRYAFVAWNVTSDDPTFADYAVDDVEVRFTAASSIKTPVTATAWYAPLGIGSGPPRVACYGLDRQINRFFRKSPIASAVPPGAWPVGAGRVVATETAVDVTAGALMNGKVMIDKIYAYVASQADFTVWRMRGRSDVVGSLHLAFGTSGIAIAVYEARVIGKVFPTMDYELFKLLTGHGDLDGLRRVTPTPGGEPPWLELNLAHTTRALASLPREHVELIRDRARDLRARADLVVQIADRVVRG